MVASSDSLSTRPFWGFCPWARVISVSLVLLVLLAALVPVRRRAPGGFLFFNTGVLGNDTLSIVSVSEACHLQNLTEVPVLHSIFNNYRHRKIQSPYWETTRPV
jgi:hypothetical protein